MIQKFSLFVLLLLSLAACQMKSEAKEEVVLESKSNLPLKDVTDYQQRMLELDSRLTQMQVANSLYYTKGDQSTEQVDAYLNSAGNIEKITETYYLASKKENGQREYYLRDGQRFATREKFIINNSPDSKYKERISYYNEAEQVLYTKMREAPYEEDLEKVLFSEVDPTNCPLTTARAVLNQEGPFETTFQGFLSEGPIDYVIVGGKGEDGYASAIAIQYEDDQIGALKSNPQTYIGNPLIVEFEKLRDERNFEFQVLLRLRIV
jgi:hypothetical protein